jgi:hypothetical protein
MSDETATHRRTSSPLSLDIPDLGFVRVRGEDLSAAPRGDEVLPATKLAVGVDSVAGVEDDRRGQLPDRFDPDLAARRRS